MTTVESSAIQPSHPRQRVQVTFEDGSVFEGPLDTPIEVFIAAWEKANQIPLEHRAIGAVADNQLRELTVPVQRDMTVTRVTLHSNDGNRIYRRTLSFLLVVAVEECLGAKVVVDHAMPGGAFFCWIEGFPHLTPSQIDQIKQKMHAIVEADELITRTILPLDEAEALFAERSAEDKLRLLEIRDRDYLAVYTLRGYVDYFFGYMAPSTGYIRWFDLLPVDGGVALRYPRSDKPGKLPPFIHSPKLVAVFRQSGEWLRLLDIRDMGQLNKSFEEGRDREIVLVTEALHERQIARIAEHIAARHRQGVRIVLIAGPSSSGKTTFSKRLAIQIMTLGLKPFTVEMDNYFVDRDKTPRDENGEYDFESLAAMRIEQLNNDLRALISGQEVILPKFDFKTGTSSLDVTVRLSSDHIIVLEGIHGMNPALTPNLPPETVHRVYISPLTQLNIDRHNRVPTTDVRLLRRIVRDARFRNYTAEETLSRWESVRRGEKRNIFPYQENAHDLFNSALVYELAVLRPLAEPLLLRVDSDSPARIEAHRLLSFLRWVRPIEAEFVPDNSLLREFIGGSILRDYHPGAPY